LNRLNQTYFKEYFRQTLAIGIHGGTVIKGTIRLGRHIHTLVMGNAVNIAARLQNAVKFSKGDHEN
jgi:class 3 adenylate cyclase